MKNKIILGIAGVLLALASWFVGQASPAKVGSIVSNSSYNSTTTDSTHASAVSSNPACIGFCQFGSIVVTQVGSAGWVRVWDATSTATSSYTSTKTATYGRQLAQITGASDVAGTYTFDIQAEKGVVVETSTGFDGQYVVTYKQ